METNFFGALRVTRAALPELRAHGGVIISISSMAGVVGISGAGAYCASKFALEGLSESLAHELAPFGIKVMIVEPSSFRTDFHGRSMRTTETRLAAYAGTQAGDMNTLLENYLYSAYRPGSGLLITTIELLEAVAAAHAKAPLGLSLMRAIMRSKKH